MSEGSPRRPKRQSSSKMKKFELLAKMRDSAKEGRKLKYEVGKVDNVYEEVDEKEYSRKVLQRQEEDWIVDDDGCGYVEDGREIFDDDLDEASVEKSKTDSVGKKRSRSAIEPSQTKKGNIRNMLVSMPTKKRKEEIIKLDEDNVLDDIIGELDTIKTTPKSSQKISMAKSVEKEMSARDYMQSFTYKRKNKPEKTILSEQLKNMNQISDINNSSLDVKPIIKSEDFKISNELINGTNTSHVSMSDVSSDSGIQTAMETISDASLNIKEEVKEESAGQFDENLFEDLGDDLGELIDQASKENTPGKPLLDIQGKPEEGHAKNQPIAAKQLSFLSNQNSPKPKIKECISEEWEDSCSTESPPAHVEIDKSTLPLTKNKNGENVFRFYYWDAHENFTRPGTVYLFGKTYIESAKAYVSCCITVKNIERRLFILPRENRVNLQTGVESSDAVSMVDVYNEFNEKITPKFKIESFKSRKITKKYAFGKQDIPTESEYLEVRYSSNYPALPRDLSGETFSCVFGTKTSFLELLILDRGLKGPGWIDIKNAEPNPASISWCKVEVNCSKPTNIIRLNLDEKRDIPPVVMLTIVPYFLFNPSSKQNEVVAVACLINNSYPVDKPPPRKLFNQHFCLMRCPAGISWPFDLRESLQKFTKTRVEKMDSERALLNLLLTKIYKIDPDIIVGHDLVGYGIDSIVDQLDKHKVPNWSRFGRLRRLDIPKGKNRFQVERIALTGRLLCDIKLSAMEFIKSRSYDLDTLCQNVLHFPEDKRPEINEDIFKYSYSSGEILLSMMWNFMCDASYILRIFAELNVLPLSLQISNIAGNVMSRTLMGGRSERNEFLLLHAFHNKDYIVPDKEYKKTKDEGFPLESEGNKPARKKPAYAGGLVLDPKVGLYDDFILLMDFNSLYPSIIQEYNICFTTVNISAINMENDDWAEQLEKLLPDDTLSPGVLPTEIRKLVDSRKEVKNLLKNGRNLSPELRMQYDIRQMALKLTANSMYGCLGFTHSRFYAKPLAAIVTEKGREILKNTKQLVESYGHEVVYGDTDSIMINTRTKNYDQVFQVGKKIKSDVNKNYKLVELDIDGVFKSMLLLKKKKYAAVTISKLPNGEFFEKKEMKGLDIVRRDWSQLSAEIGKSVLEEILKDQSPDDKMEAIHSCLQTVRDEMLQGKVPINLLCVTKQLSRAPESYSDAKAQPHVQVALRLNKASARRFKQGDTVSYIICEDGTTNPATQRAYHIEELKNPELNLKIDTMYYLSQQIHPVIARLCEPIDGIDGASIALSLNLDPNAYKQKVKMCDNEAENPDILLRKSDSERFKNCERFSFICNSCKTENILEGPTRKLVNGIYVVSLEKCINTDCNVSPLSQYSSLICSLNDKMYNHIDKFYESWLRCSICDYRKRGVDSLSDEIYPKCPTCHKDLHKEITPLQLSNQLNFYAHLFDLNRMNLPKRINLDKDTQYVYTQLFSTVDEVLKKSSYYVIDCNSLFSSIFSSFVGKIKF